MKFFLYFYKFWSILGLSIFFSKISADISDISVKSKYRYIRDYRYFHPCSWCINWTRKLPPRRSTIGHATYLSLPITLKRWPIWRQHESSFLYGWGHQNFNHICSKPWFNLVCQLCDKPGHNAKKYYQNWEYPPKAPQANYTKPHGGSNAQN